MTRSGSALIDDAIGPFSGTPNGIAYVPEDDAMWVAFSADEGGSPNSDLLKYSCADGSLLFTSKLEGWGDIDCMTWDPASGCLFCTVGSNTGNGTIVMYDPMTRQRVRQMQQLKRSHAIEGIVKDGEFFITAHDPGFHDNAYGGLGPFNMIKTYRNRLKLPSGAATNRLVIAGIIRRPSLANATAQAKVLMSCGDPIDWYGWGIHLSHNSNSISMWARNHFVDQNPWNKVFPGPNAGEVCPFIFDVEVGVSCKFYIHGQEVTASSETSGSMAIENRFMNPAGVNNLNVGAYELYATTPAPTRMGTFDWKTLLVSRTAVDIEKLSGFLAWRAGPAAVASLDSGHAYKSAPPTW